MWRYVRNDELYHYGILGMRWGVRRYQYKDGSLTPAGKKRAAKLARKYRETVGVEISPGIKTKRRIEDMSNEELAERTTRTRLENEYIRSLADHKNLTKHAEPALKKYVKETLLPTVTKNAADMLKDRSNQIIQDLWEEKIAPSAGVDKYTWSKAIKGANNKADFQKAMNRITEEQAKQKYYEHLQSDSPDDWWRTVYKHAYKPKTVKIKSSKKK